MKYLAPTLIVLAGLLLGPSARGQEFATPEFQWDQFQFVTDATAEVDSSTEFAGFSNVPEALLLANSGFMAMRNRQFEQAIAYYTQAAQRDPKYQDMLDYVTNLRNQYWSGLEGPMNVAEMRLPAQWGEEHSVDTWARVRVKFWLGWFKSVLPKDQGQAAMGGMPVMYDIPQDPNMMGVPPPIGPGGAYGGGATGVNPLGPTEMMNQL